MNFATLWDIMRRCGEWNTGYLDDFLDSVDFSREDFNALVDAFTALAEYIDKTGIPAKDMAEFFYERASKWE